MEAIVIAYLISVAVFIPVSGWVGDRWGTKKTFLAALALFTIASALCGLSQNIGQMVVFRVLQGAGGGLLTPVGMAMLYRAYPPAERVGVSRILMWATTLGPALGPIIGGLLIEHLSWRWIFYVNIPVGIAAIAFGWAFLAEHREPKAGRFDAIGFVLAGTGLGALMYALTEGPNVGWTSPRILGLGIAGIVLLVGFTLTEMRVAEPMVNLRLLSNRLFRSTLFVSMFTASAFMGTLFLMPLFLQEGRGVSPLTSGLATFPEAVGVVLSTQIVARLYPRVGPSRLMATGLTFVALVALVMSSLSGDSSLWLIRGLMFLLGFGVAYVFLPNQAASMATISSEDMGRASTLFSVQRQIGGAIGIAILSTILRITGDGEISVGDTSDFKVAFWGAACLGLIGAFFALRVPDREAAATMRPRRIVAEAHAD